MIWQRLRWRWAQCLVFVLLSALTSGCLIVAPLLARAEEQGLLRARIDHLDPADTALTISAKRGPFGPFAMPSDLDEHVPGPSRRYFPTRIGMIVHTGLVATRPRAQPSPVRLVARDGVCTHLRFTAGRCPAAAGEVSVSSADAQAWPWVLGQVLTLPYVDAPADGGPSDPGLGRLRIVGIYQVLEDPGYWLRFNPVGKSGVVAGGGGLNPPAGVDDLLTTPLTFEQAWRTAVDVSASYPMARDQFTLESLADLAGSLTAAPTQLGIYLDAPVAELASSIQRGQQTARFLVPVIAGQLALLALAVLFAVAQAGVEQRRSELALARIRGKSRFAAGAWVVTELGTLALVGLPLGVGGAVAAGALARRILPAGVPAEFPPGSVAASGAAAILLLATIVAATAPVARQPVLTLLSPLTPRRGARRFGLLSMVLVVLAVVDVAGLSSGSLVGPLALLTPVLLALAASLLIAAPLTRLLIDLAHVQLRRGRIARPLAALSISRRAGLRWHLAVISSACAVAVFAANSAVVAERNQASRARLVAGAPAVLVTDAASPASVVTVLDGLPSGLRARAMPVALIRSADRRHTTLAARPDELARIAYPPDQQAPLQLGALAVPPVEPLRLAGTTLTAQLTWSPDPATVPPVATVPGGFLTGQVGITVTTARGEQLSRDLGAIPIMTGSTVAVRAPLLCPDGCQLRGLWLRLNGSGIPQPVEGTLSVRQLALDGRRLDLADQRRWQPTPTGTGEFLRVTSTDQAGPLTLTTRNDLSRLSVWYADVPVRIPVILAGDFPPGGQGEEGEIQGLTGAPLPARAAQRVAALPRATDVGALANLDTLLRLGGVLPQTGSMEVWLDTTAPADLDRVRTALADEHIRVLSAVTAEAINADYAASATGWSYLLALAAAALAVLIGAVALVLLALSGWRQSGRDLASLRLQGVSTSVLRRATVLEYLGMTGFAVLVGLSCGLVAITVGTSALPMFDAGPPTVPALDLGVAWAWIGAVAAGVTAVFLATAGSVASWLARRSARALPEEDR